MARPKTPFTLTRAEERSGALINRRTLPDGTSVTAFTIDLSNTKPPERSYYAKEASINFDRGVVSIIFAQKAYSAEALRSAIAINMAPTAVLQFLDNVNAMPAPSLTQIAERMELTAEKLGPLNAEPEQVVELSANIVGTAVSGYESTLDFYKASPFAVLKLQAGRALDLDPQVRVDLRTSLLLGLVSSLEQLAKTFPAKAFMGREAQ